MFLIPLIFHHALGLPLTITLVVAIVAARVIMKRRRTIRRAGSPDRRLSGRR